MSQTVDVKTPGILDRIPHIIRMWENDCDPPWTLVIETAGPPLTEAIITLLTFGLDDVARGYLRPKGLRGSGRTRRRDEPRNRQTRQGAIARAFRKGLPEVGEAIGRELPGRGFFEGRKAGGVERWLWTIDGVIQQGLWWWLVADVTTEFIYDWTSGIYSSKACADAWPIAGAWVLEGTPHKACNVTPFATFWLERYARNCSNTNGRTTFFGDPASGLIIHKTRVVIGRQVTAPANYGIQARPIFGSPGAMGKGHTHVKSVLRDETHTFTIACQFQGVTGIDVIPVGHCDVNSPPTWLEWETEVMASFD